MPKSNISDVSSFNSDDELPFEENKNMHNLTRQIHKGVYLNCLHKTIL